MVKERNVGIDILKIVAMMMIVILHFLGHGGVLKSLDFGILKRRVFWFLELNSFLGGFWYIIRPMIMVLAY